MVNDTNLDSLGGRAPGYLKLVALRFIFGILGKGLSFISLLSSIDIKGISMFMDCILTVC